MHTPRHNQQLSNKHTRDALTLVELIIVIILLTLFLSLLTPALQAAKNQSRSQVCLTNLKSLGNAIYTYAAEYNNVLPGPAYPALNHHQTVQDYQNHGYTTEYAEYEINRRLTTLLSNVQGNNQTDQQITCPTMAAIVPDQNFEAFEDRAGFWIWPTHYTLNNVSYHEVDYGAFGGAGPTREGTSPANYFGYNPSLSAYNDPTSPQPLVKIPNASREWMIADAWYRQRINVTLTFLQQEGPYQWEYSGLPLPPFAPHSRRAGQSYNYTSKTIRNGESSKVRAQKSDGQTNTLFFDGHAAPVPSRTATINGYQQLYGFPGTVNPYLRNAAYEIFWSRIVWE